MFAGKHTVAGKLMIIFCGPEYQRSSTEISEQVWCEGSSEGKRVLAGRHEVSAMPSRSLGNSEGDTDEKLTIQ